MTLPDAGRWAAIAPRLDELLSLPPAERAGRLDALMVGSPATAQQLRLLLGSLDDAGAEDFLASADAASPAPAPGQGDVVGSWMLVERIGEGGMGSVWRARRSDGRFEGEAAIKLLRSGLFDDSAQARFRREGAILARLRHPGIARLLDAGVSPRGQPYLVLEYVNGEPIDHWVQAHRPSVRGCVELFIEVLDAVSAAHAQLVIHRDLKPSNILVDAAGCARLLDFGIARLQDEDDDAGLTRAGALALTPRYAAPEQFSRGTLSMATDVYALGLLLYELLTGEHPSGLAAEAAPVEYMQAAAAGDFRPASERAPQLRRELRGDLDTVLAKALATQPEARYASVAALRDDLHRYLRHEPLLAQPPGLLYRCRKLLRRRPIECAVVLAAAVAVPAGAHVQAAVLASMGLGTAAALWQARRARQQAALAQAEQRRAGAVKAFIASTFSQAVPREGAGGVVSACDLLHSAAARVRSELKAQPLVAAELMAIIGNSFLELGDTPAGLQVLHDAIFRCEQAFGRLHPLTLKTRCAMLRAYNVMGELDASERLQPPLVADLRATMPASARDLVSVLRSRSYTLTKRGAEAEAVQALEEAWALGRAHLGADDEDTLAAAGLLGNTLNTFGRLQQALDVLDQAVVTARDAYGDRRPHSSLACIEAFRAEVLANMGRVPEAVERLREASSDLQALDGMDTSRTLYAKGCLARSLADGGALAEAIAVMREVVAADQRLFSKPTVDTGTRLSRLGRMLVDRGESGEGLSLMQHAEHVIQQAGGGAANLTHDRLAARAWATLQAGQADEALAAAHALLACSEPVAAGPRAVAERARVGALRSLGRLDDAEAHLQGMLDAASAPGATVLHQGRAALEAAALRVAQGRWADAEALVRQALPVLLPSQSPDSPLLQRAQELLQACQGRGP